MSLRLFASWDFALIGQGQFLLDDDGSANFVTYSSGVYDHTTVGPSVVSSILHWGTALKTLMDATSTGAGTYTVSFDESTLKYTISYSSGNFDMTFSGAAGDVMKNLLGFTGNKTGASSYTSDVAVYYAIDGTLGAKSEPVEEEPDDIAVVGEADDGSSYGISRTTAPIYYDCLVTYEPEARVRTAKLAAAYPWTWQRFFAHVRAHGVFTLKDSSLSENTVHKLRAEGASFRPIPAASDPNYVGHYHIRLRTYLLGRG